MYCDLLIYSTRLVTLQSQPILGEGGNIHIYLAELEGSYTTNLMHGDDADKDDVKEYVSSSKIEEMAAC